MGPNGKYCQFKKSKDYLFTFTINPLFSYYTARDEFFRCNQGNWPVEEYLMPLQRLTDLMDYPNDGNTVDQFLLDKMITSINDAQLRQKLYKDSKDLTMEELYTSSAYVQLSIRPKVWL